MADERFSFRWGIPWLDAGFVQVPDFFFDVYVDLGVTRPEFLFILHLARYRYESVRGQARPGIGTVARQMGLSARRVQQLRASLEKKGLLIVEPRTGRPSVYSFENFARACLKRARLAEENFTPEAHFTPGGETHFTPPMKPTSPKEQKEEQEEQQQQAVVAFSPAAEEGEGMAGLVGLGVDEKKAAELSAGFDGDRILAVVAAAVANKQVRNKASWAVTALQRHYVLPEDGAETEQKEKLRVSALSCMYARNPGLGECVAEETGQYWAPCCSACPRGEVVKVA